MIAPNKAALKENIAHGFSTQLCGSRDKPSAAAGIPGHDRSSSGSQQMNHVPQPKLKGFFSGCFFFFLRLNVK